MKIVLLYAAKDGKSYFKDIVIDTPIQNKLGFYCEKINVNNMYVRHFDAGLEFTWHCAPQKQYIIYLSGKVEVEASGGEKRIFCASDILYATDTTGMGHVTRTLAEGESIIVTSAGVCK